jgi:hypothetical protein
MLQIQKYGTAIVSALLALALLATLLLSRLVRELIRFVIPHVRRRQAMLQSAKDGDIAGLGASLEMGANPKLGIAFMFKVRFSVTSAP